MRLWMDLFISFFKIGGLTFGGGLAMLPMLKREVVENHNWSTEEELLDMYAIGQCTPGIIAVNTATYVGFRQSGLMGSIFSTLGVISPSLIIICLVASVLENFMDQPILLHAFAGIRLVVCALMIHTVVAMCRKGIVDKTGLVLFGTAFIVAVFTPVPTVLIIVASAVTGILKKAWEARKQK